MKIKYRRKILNTITVIHCVSFIKMLSLLQCCTDNLMKRYYLRYYSIIIYQETICSLVSARKQILLDGKIKTIKRELIQTTGHHPFLFVGSGLSKRSLGSEKWDELLRKFCTEFSSNEFQYDVYANMVDEKDYYGQQPAIAYLLEKDYNNKSSYNRSIFRF